MADVTAFKTGGLTTSTDPHWLDSALAGVSDEQARAKQILDGIVGFRVLAAAGALIAAVAPAVIATAEGDTLRGSISAYYNIEQDHLFWMPFAAAALLLFTDGLLSYVAPNRSRLGGRWFNLVLGVALAMLTAFNLDDDKVLHYVGAYTFFILFVAVIWYTTWLAWRGRPVDNNTELAVDRPVERGVAQVSLVFLALLVLTLIAWGVGLVSFFFLELFALVNFALYYVQGSLHPFPYRQFEFRSDRLNRIFRALHIMR